MNVTFTVNPKKVALSSSNSVYKTEGFIAATRRILLIDAFLSRAAEGVMGGRIDLPDGCYSAQTADGAYTLYFCKKSSPQGAEYIFYKFLGAATDEGGVDRGVGEYLSSHDEYEMIIKEADEAINSADLSRLYLTSGSDGMLNFPHLTETQRRIVETEDSNMLVQGVAGSGKTNVCVEKIVYCACRDYRGRVLYTTFSRGLLAETKERVGLFLKNVEDFISAYEAGNAVFLDPNHIKAVENKLGILFSVDEDGQMISSLKRVAEFLREKVDYLLIEDLFARREHPAKVAGENEFINEYLAYGKGSRMSGALDKLKNISPEVVYKEIYGMIFGKYELSSPSEMMSRAEYIEARKDSFSPRECDLIYSVAADYAAFMAKKGYEDNNSMSRRLLSEVKAPEYSVGVIDEVQDFTQVNLCLIKTLCRKLFCVGDALQMINPSYFNFGYLKRLMYGDVTGVSELKHNFRSTERIEKISEKLGEMNVARFGTHSFVLKGESVPSPLSSEAVFVKDKNFLPSIASREFENLTVIVSSRAKKESAKKLLGRTEVLTVAEAKGLERNAVVLVDVLSDNADKWRYLHEMTLNRKTADENSVFRYYFNLFYVGVSRARQHLFVVESDYPKFFDSLFDECFERRGKERAVALLKDIAGKTDLGDDELIERIEKFCSLEQYDNARAAANRLSSEELRDKRLIMISAHEKFLRFGDFRSAGVEYWKRGMDPEARQMFARSGDERLFPLMDACLEGGSSALDPDIARFFPLVEDNELAKSIILETLSSDHKEISASLTRTTEALRRKK